MTNGSAKTADHCLERNAAELEAVLGRFVTTRGAVLDAALASIAARVRSGGKVLVFGNGGSAAEAQHFTAELINGFKDRGEVPLAAIALTADTISLTAIANDRSFARVFSRQIEALGRPGDVAVALTTSGTSADVIEGMRTARARGLLTVALTGQTPGDLAPLADFILDVPSCSTPRIQEMHLIILHTLAEGLGSIGI